MIKKFLLFVWVFIVCVLSFSFVFATPSTTYWTPCTMDIQPYRKGHITYDSYFTVGKRGTHKGEFATDIGLTYGVLPFKKLQMEVGYDLMEPSDNPSFYNAKIGMPEGSLFKNSPGLGVGIFNIGTKKHATDYNIVDFIAGKTLPFNLGRLHLGGYTGNGKTLKSASGKKQPDGFMFGYDYGFWPVKDEKGEFKFNRFVLAGDYASGQNTIGGGGVGLYIYLTPDIDLLSGPVWFNDHALNGDMKWTMQLDINF